MLRQCGDRALLRSDLPGCLLRSLSPPAAAFIILILPSPLSKHTSTSHRICCARQAASTSFTLSWPTHLSASRIAW